MDYVGGTNHTYHHGTHVAGIIGAQGNNSIGISGVAWNSVGVAGTNWFNGIATLHGVSFAFCV